MRNPSGACLLIAIVLTGLVQASAAAGLGIHSVPGWVLPVASLASLCLSGLIVLAGINAAVKRSRTASPFPVQSVMTFPEIEVSRSGERSARRRGRDSVEMTHIRRRNHPATKTVDRLKLPSQIHRGIGRGGDVSRSKGE